MWYNIRRADIILGFQSFFSPLAGQPKKTTYYTITAAPLWYNMYVQPRSLFRLRMVSYNYTVIAPEKQAPNNFHTSGGIPDEKTAPRL